MGRVVARGRIGSGGGAIEPFGSYRSSSSVCGSGGGGGLGFGALAMKARCAGRDRAWDWWIDGFFCGYTRCIFALFSDGLHDSLDCGDGRADEIRCKVIMTSVYAQMCAHESEVQCCCVAIILTLRTRMRYLSR